MTGLSQGVSGTVPPWLAGPRPLLFALVMAFALCWVAAYDDPPPPDSSASPTLTGRIDSDVLAYLLLLVLGLAAVFLFWRLSGAIGREPLGFESHWGGFGGGLGGWRVSSSMALLIAAITVSGLFVWTTFRLMDRKESPSNVSEGGNEDGLGDEGEDGKRIVPARDKGGAKASLPGGSEETDSPEATEEEKQ